MEWIWGVNRIDPPVYPFRVIGFLPLFSLFLFLTLPLRAESAPPTATPSNGNARAFPAWTEACRQRVTAAAKEAQAADMTVDLLFLGDSLTERWLKADEGLALWERYYARHALNFGVSADGTEHLLWRLQTIDLSSFVPTVRTVVILIGTNDSTYPPQAVVAGIDAVLARSRALFPEAKTILVGLPRNARADAVTQAVNETLRLRDDGKKTFYLDLPGAMTPDPAAKSWRGLGPDRLHFSSEGYRMWADLLNATLERIKKEGAEASAPAPLAK